MRDKFFLFLTDDEIILYKGSTKKSYFLTEGMAHIQSELKKLFSLSSKVPICLVIDRNHQDIREEQLPLLPLWDRFRLLSHKKEGWKVQGGFYGYRFFKQDGKSFFQWVNITSNDFLLSWFSWINSLSNPFGGVFFVALEAGNFLRKRFSSSHDYHMLIYNISSQKMRYVIFKGRCLLLFRTWSGDEDFRKSLHFLSRVYPDIHENLHILSLVPNISLAFSHNITFSNFHVFIDFLTFQKSSALSININPLSQNQWVRRGMGGLVSSFLLLIALLFWQGLNYKRETQAFLSKIDALKAEIQNKKVLLKNNDVVFFRLGLDDYNHVKAQMKDPLKILEKLSSILTKHHLRLDSLIWNYEQTMDIEMSFIMHNHKVDKLSDQFNLLLASLLEIFPCSNIQIIEAPFKSGIHEAYTHPTELSVPMARIRVVLP